MEDFKTRVARLAAMLKKANNGVLMTGAGFSTESGLGDFRSPGAAEAAARTYGYPPERILTRDFADRLPELFWRYYREVFLAPAEPNPGHFAAAALEKERRLSVVTQNCDGLHQRAGSVRVLELHGSIRENRCADCAKYFPEEVVRTDAPVPRCPACGGTLLPGIVLYDDPLDEGVLRTAKARMFSADLLIVAGTSLSVYPAADLPQYYPGRNLVVINRTPTPLDGDAALLFREDTGKVLSAALEVYKTLGRPAWM
ncbi:MAG: Sir2 family NAD-dependent protein deacetylase [Clostridia bacterium]|nr:Sir2 family NAD-dependent protein deacetylase [Clostridia bacterium]